MVWYLAVSIFIFSCILLSWLSSRLIGTLVQIAKYLQWREFIIAFFVMAFATSLPNLFIDVNAAMQGKPHLALGDIIGGNLADLTLVLAVAVFFSKKGLSAQSDIVQKSAMVTTIIAILPLILILDGGLGRFDGAILILSFFVYAVWIFSKNDRFKKVYKTTHKTAVSGFRGFLFNIIKIIIILGLLLLASQAVVGFAQYFSDKLGISLGLVGILIVGLGNCFPEAYFSIISAKKGEGWMVLGDLMGSVIVCATLVLGTVALISPFQIIDFSPFLIARFFVLIAIIFYLFAIKTDRKITKKEGL